MTATFHIAIPPSHARVERMCSQLLTNPLIAAFASAFAADAMYSSWPDLVSTLACFAMEEYKMIYS